MPEGVWLALAWACSLLGAAALALALDPHWQQARGSAAAPGRGTATLLRAAGGAAWLGALTLCLRADHASMAVLVWIMSLAAASLLVALVLAWRPRWLGWLTAWSRPAR